jgi:hypothetical protein
MAADFSGDSLGDDELPGFLGCTHIFERGVTVSIQRLHPGT